MSGTAPTWFCPRCHAVIDAHQRRCPHCGADIALWEARPYGERLLDTLRHPLSEARMGAIIALGKRGDLRTAAALAQCALAHPRDVVQGLAVVQALARMPAGAARTRALAQLGAHPAHAVAAAARQQAQSAPPAVAAVRDRAALRAQVMAWCHDLADHAGHEPDIAALGADAVPGLRAVLEAPPEAVNAARLFAVGMLARIDDGEAHRVLRTVLYHPPPASLPPPIAEAERAVKSAVLRALAGRDPAGCADDVAWALQVARLPAAAGVAGMLRLRPLAPALARMLDDDVLAQPAADALRNMPETAVAALHAPLLEWLPRDDARARLACVRALLLLADLGVCPAIDLWRGAWHAAHPAVRAAAACCAWRRRPRPALMGALLVGALLPETALSQVCRDALETRLRWPISLQRIGRRCRHGVPDVYGNRQAPERGPLRWLDERLAARAGPPLRR